MRSALLLFLCVGGFAASPAKILQTAPIQFEHTGSQWTARGLGYAFRFEKTGTAMRLDDGTLRMTFEDSNPSAPFVGLDHSVHPTNSFHGQNYQRIENFARLRRTGIYPGIDLLYYSRNGELEYDFEIAPQADPSRIALSIEGADRARLNDHGDLVLTLAGKDLLQRAPSVYQRLASGEIVNVDAAYHIGVDGRVRFKLGNYDRSTTLVIDPAIVYVAFVGGSGGDVGVSVGHDAQGNMYIGGNTFSLDFPIGANAFKTTAAGEEDCFLFKLNPNATDPTQTILYSSYYGGTSNEILTAMKVTPAGLMYFTGSTNSTNYPVTTGAFSGVLSTGTHAFVTVLDSNQNGFDSQIYSTYYGGTTTIYGAVGSADSGQGIFVGSTGLIYVTGYTTSIDLPLTGAFQASLDGSYDAFVATFDPNQIGPSSLIFSTYLGGYAQDWGQDIAVDQNGLIYITGFTFSSDFPFTAGTAYRNYSGEGDAFMTVLNSGAGTIVYSTFLGGSNGFDEGNRILVDPKGQTVAVAGYTMATDYPVTQNAYQSVMPALSNIDNFGNQLGSNGFLTVFNMAAATAPGQGATYSTYFGGFGGEVIYGLRVDSQGRYYICGYTLSQNLPVTGNAFNTTSAGGGLDGFVAVLNPAAVPSSQLVYSTYITSVGTQTVNDVDVDANGVVWITGVCTWDIFPPGYEQFPVNESTVPPQSEAGKQSSFLWGFTIQ
ncbi:MAG TPA: SBBP repeat-containing protein [Bryobacteraceae bacterium]|jgi:hypothetical protein|nr:SBBP repeat-containing protein [Bryobacteraceae bacterium]